MRDLDRGGHVEPAALLRDALITVVEFAQVSGADLLLPAELLPDADWAGRSARELLITAAEGHAARIGDKLPHGLRLLLDTARLARHPN
ncbi:hypothetical protein [Nonomuraea sp. NPDC050310]|uniref:hypothetical protein n=1 Tax=Nonomuraea sp. NPDC050310 TaxID=3154935 RepID=UPI0034104EA5